MGLDIYSRDPITLNVIRDRQSLYRETLDDGIENSYLLKIRNKTQQDKHYRIEISGALPYKLSTNSVHIAAGEQYELPLTLTVPVAQIDNNRSNLLFKVLEADAPDNSVSQKSVFFAP
jgi:polyferredoxin